MFPYPPYSANMEPHFVKGQQLLIRLVKSEYSYEGSFLSMSSDRTRITLHKVTRLPDKKFFDKEYNFFRNEIESIRAAEIESGMEAFLDPTQGRMIGYFKEPSHAHLYRMAKQSVPSPQNSEQLNEARRSHPQYPKFQRKLEQYVIVDKIDEKFIQLMTLLKEADYIGCSVEGDKIGRQGQLCWLNLSTRRHTVLFDILALGHDAFDKGLREILENKDTTKVMHNCRLAADCFQHQFNTKLQQVIDAQALDLLVYRNNNEKMPFFVTSLNDCLHRYLKMPMDILIFPFIRERHVQRDSAKWSTRPAAQEDLLLAVQNVALLLDLHKAQLECLLGAAYQMSAIFKNQVASMPDKEASDFYGYVHMTPRKAFGVRGVGSRRSNTNDPQNKSCVTTSNIRYSRDVMHFFDASENDEAQEYPQKTPLGTAVPKNPSQ